MSMGSRATLIAVGLGLAVAAGGTALSQQRRTLSAAPTKSKVPARLCASAPRLDLSPLRWADPRDEYGDGTRNYARFVTNFHAAYDAACKAGWLTKARLSDPRAAHPGILFLATAPQANIASIYFDDAADTPPKERELLLEWSFVNEGYVGQVPSVAVLRSAIKCYAQAKSGRSASDDCLPD